MLKKINFVLFSGLIALGLNFNAYADYDEFDFDEEEIVVEEEPVVKSNIQEQEIAEADEMSASAINDYEIEGSLFEKITNLEQEKVVLQLEKERAQLDLELERLNAEKIKLQMELDTLSGRAEQQQKELQVAKAQLDAQTEQIKRQREKLDEEEYEEDMFYKKTEPTKKQKKTEDSDIASKYKLVNVIGVGNELQATIEETSSGQTRRIAVGKFVDGYIVKSISLNDGIVLDKNGETEILSIGK